MKRTTLRLILLISAMALGAAYFTDIALAQDAAEAAAQPAKSGKFETAARLVFSEIDFVTVIIFILSVISVTYIIRGFLQSRASVIIPDEATARIRDLITNRQFTELLDYTEKDPSFVSKVINPALKRAPKYEYMKESMEVAIGEETADSFRKIEILNVIGNLGPLLGLLGTVLGMMVAFDQMMQAQGQANPAQLAGGIATALAHTFLGLFLAIPNLAAYGVLRQKVDKLTTQAALKSEELLQLMRPSEESRSSRSAAPTAKPAKT